MKRLIALLLTLILALSALPALADDYTLVEKFCRQVLDSGYRGTITFSAVGAQTAAMDPATWLMIRTLAPRLSLEANHSNYRGDGQAALRLMLDGQTAGETTLLYNPDLVGISSDLLAGGNTYYSFSRDWDFSQMVQAVAQGEGEWPPLWRVLTAVESAPADWQNRAQEKLISYETKLGVWMNGYAAFTTGIQNELAYTQLSCSIPIQAVKAQIKQMMIDFYEDEALLSLLREVLTPEEAAAYLQPGMQNSFFAMLDALKMDGNVEIIRRYDTQGHAMLDSITMPFAPTQPFSTLTITVTPDELGQCWGFAGSTWTGADFDITCIVGADMAYSGSVFVMLPEQEDQSSFVVSDTAASRPVVAFDYNLSWNPGKESYTLATSKFDHMMEGTLVIKPQAGDDMPAQALTLTISLSSGASQRNATTLNAVLTWRDLDGDAVLTASLESKTAAPTAVDTLEDQNASMRIDLLEQQGRSALIQRWGDTMAAWLQGLLTKMFPALSATTPNL